jgi:hypothetical protein
MFGCVFPCCVFMCRQRPLRLTDHLFKRVLTSTLISLRNLGCEAAKVLTRIVEPLTMMMKLKQLTRDKRKSVLGDVCLL